MEEMTPSGSVPTSTYNSKDDRSQLVVHVVASILTLSTLALAMRLWSRTILPGKRKLWWDDWAVIATWAHGAIMSSICLEFTRHGLGRHTGEISPEDLAIGSKLCFVAAIIVASGFGLVKLSALLFYQRVFGSAFVDFKRALYVMYVLLVVWTLFWTIFNLVQCVPYEKAFAPGVNGRCVNQWQRSVANVIVDVLLDAIIVVMPMPILWRMHTGWTKRLAITLVFVCGYLALAPSLTLLITCLQRGPQLFMNDYTYAALPMILSGYCEVSVCVISLCLPGCIHLLRYYTRHICILLSQSRSKSRNMRLGIPQNEKDVEHGGHAQETSDSSESEYK